MFPACLFIYIIETMLVLRNNQQLFLHSILRNRPKHIKIELNQACKLHSNGFRYSK